MQDKIYNEIVEEFGSITKIPVKKDNLALLFDEEHLKPSEQLSYPLILEKLREYKYIIEKEDIGFKEYVRAMRFVLYHYHYNMGVTESYMAVFPDRVQKSKLKIEQKRGVKIDYHDYELLENIRPRASLFKANRVVKALLGIYNTEIASSFVLERVQILKKLVEIGLGTAEDAEIYSGKTRIDAMNVVLNHTKMPEITTKVDVNIDNRKQTVEQHNYFKNLESVWSQVVEQQKKSLSDKVISVTELGAFDARAVMGKGENNNAK